jgi:hypothetical protein
VLRRYGDFPRVRRFLDANTYAGAAVPPELRRRNVTPSFGFRQTSPMHTATALAMASSPRYVEPGGVAAVGGSTGGGAGGSGASVKVQWGSLREREMAEGQPGGKGVDASREERDAGGGGGSGVTGPLEGGSWRVEDMAAAEAAAEEERAAARAIVRTVQATFLIMPLVVLMVLSLLLSSVQWAATLIETTNTEAGSTVAYYTRPWMLDLLVTATSRLSRTLRFTLFLGLVQWNQQFHAMFPRWYVVLGRRFKYATPLKIALTLVSLPSALRFFEWTLKPSGLNKGAGSVLLPGVPHTVIDNFLVMAWIALFLLAAVVLLQLPTADLINAGYRKEIFSDADTWCQQTVRFKGMLIFMTSAHLVRGIVSSRMGFTFAQNDNILIMLEYPMLLVTIWTACVLAVILRPHHLKIFPPLLLVAWGLSHYLAQVDEWGVVLCCWLHLSRLAVMYFARSSPVLLGMRKADEQAEKTGTRPAALPPPLPSATLRPEFSQSWAPTASRSRSLSLGASDSLSVRCSEGRLVEGDGSNASREGSGGGSGVSVGGGGRNNPGVSPRGGVYTGGSDPPMSPNTAYRINTWKAAVRRASGPGGGLEREGVPPLVRSDSEQSLASEASCSGGRRDWGWLGSGFAADDANSAVSVFAPQRHRVGPRRTYGYARKAGRFLVQVTS